ncbi:acyl-CoA thioesterase [Rhizobium mongolense]|uniref:Acyl-CoA thioesterase FadM n=2 Tax=Rhizobium mongolense TaxID=57676 RepID=A0ABR6IXG7_9HYPH|nr:thioesterase family protein [Rhizobium mongolense]MBB4232605.1 acyl-CoA thioesterase FadM [Rhizobium mongolense]TVZ74976.1 (3S)-malyl-CoA thioesterase [Rhizobium mongolense USDA 1844]
MTWVVTWTGTVDRDWIDELDHVNFLQYQRVADLASLDIWKNARGKQAGSLEFVMTETHVRYVRELRLGMPVEVNSALLAFDNKRFQLFHHIKSDGELMCSVETLNLCFDPEIRKVATFTEAIVQYFESWGSPPPDATYTLSIARKQS